MKTMKGDGITSFSWGGTEFKANAQGLIEVPETAVETAQSLGLEEVKAPPKLVLNEKTK